MPVLVIDTVGRACSVALIDDAAVIAASREDVGRGHAERLLPMIAALPDGGRADALLVDCGPGSFTGVRVGIAAARALALGWRVPVAGYRATALLAAMARRAYPEEVDIAAVMTGGHGEYFVELFSAGGSVAPLRSLALDAALAVVGDRPMIGSGAIDLAGAGAPGRATAAETVAADAVLLAAADRGLAPAAIYGRPPDARPQG